MNKYIFLLVSFFAVFPSVSQTLDSVAARLTEYAYAVKHFGDALPQEKVYVHFDNTSYYQGDPIWFQCYVVTAGRNCPSGLSKTLYVELLNPGGETIAKQILPIHNGRSHGNFTLTQLPFYSGFYEIRAYTKYMLNFGEDVIFSRVFPVFEKPRQAGDFQERKIQKYAIYKYPQKRPRSKKAKRVNVKFYPEGGYLVRGVSSQVAFEATDAYGNPLDLSGTIVDREKKECGSFAVTREGRGVFTYTPVGEGDQALVYVDGKKYSFDLPEAIPQGIVLSVDNLFSADTLSVTVQRNGQTPGTILGLAVMSRGKLINYRILALDKKTSLCFNLDKSGWPAGVTQVVLFDTSGRTVADRLIFVGNPDPLTISLQKEKDRYEPFEPVEWNVAVRDKEGKPVQSPLSVSIRDGREEVENRYSMLTDLLLMSEIKGYVRRPSFYFEADDREHRTALDHLLMVQGWRRYAWDRWSGTEPFELKYAPEQGIEVHGQVVSLVKGKPKPNVQVSSFLMKRGEEEADGNATYINSFDTDSLGCFAFISDIRGKWNLILSVTEKGKKKDHRILLDRVFSPDPVKYNLADMQIELAAPDETKGDAILPLDTIVPLEMDFSKVIDAYEDSLIEAGVRERIYRLDNVEVKAKKRSRERDIYTNRSKSVAYYDVVSEIDDIQDQGKFIGDDIHELMLNMNQNFQRTHILHEEFLLYKGRMPLFVIDYKPTMATEMDYKKYKLLTLESIKSIYINEDIGIMCKYADPRISPMEIDKLYGCVVFVETYPEGQISTKGGKGVRKTWLEGYSEVKEFYHPDYSVLPKEEDYRRTLYWNPELIPDAEGNVKIRFYNNSRCRNFKITAETVSAKGEIGLLNE